MPRCGHVGTGERARRGGIDRAASCRGFGDLATIRMLIESGADVNAANRRKATPQFWALHDMTEVALLPEYGANVNAKNVDGRTPVYPRLANTGSSDKPLSQRCVYRRRL